MTEHNGIKMWDLIHELFKLKKQSYQLPTLSDLETRVMYVTWALYKHQDERANVKKLKNMLHVSHPTISQVVNGLEEKGFIKRIKDSTDGRISILVIEPKGQTALEESFKIVNEMFIDMSERLGEEKSLQFISILEEMIAYFKEHGGKE